MKKYTITCCVPISVSLEIEAENEEDLENKFKELESIRGMESELMESYEWWKEEIIQSEGFYIIDEEEIEKTEEEIEE